MPTGQLVQAPVATRILTPRPLLSGPGNPNALENVNGQTLPDGAMCWVISEAAWYYFQKASTTTPAPPAVIATIQGASVPGRWFKGPSAAGGGADLTALSNVFYVDASTTVAPGDQDGNIETPYASLQAAITARQGGTFLITGGTSYGDISVAGGSEYALIGLSPKGLFQVGTITVADNSPVMVSNAVVNLFAAPGALVSAMGQFAIGGVQGDENTVVACYGASGSGQASSASQIGALDIGQLNSFGTLHTGDIDTDGHASTFQNCGFIPGSVSHVTGANAASFAFDLASLASLRATGVTATASGGIRCTDAPTQKYTGVTCNGTDQVTVLTQAFSGAKPGDAFAVAVRGLAAGQCPGAAWCETADQVKIPVTCIGATTATVSITISQLPVANVT